MSQYPVILIPDKIQRVQSALPPVPAPPTAPQQPGAAPQKVNNTLIAVETAIAIPVIPVVSQITSLPSWLLFLVAAGAIAGHVWHQVKTYPERMQKHQQEVTGYKIKLQEFEHKKQLHQKEVEAARTPEKVADFQYKLLLQVLSQTIPQDDNNSNARIGRREEKFGMVLKRYFPGKIHTQLKVQNPSYSEGYHYTPDFAYIDHNLNLYIDIELDEPYTQDGKPIHFIGLSSDINRDNHFNSRGWLVIRFSEEQIAKYPQSCCKMVATVISEITNNHLILNQFTNVPDLQFVNRWTEAEARQMYLQNFRDSY